MSVSCHIDCVKVFFLFCFGTMTCRGRSRRATSCDQVLLTGSNVLSGSATAAADALRRLEAADRVGPSLDTLDTLKGHPSRRLTAAQLTRDNRHHRVYQQLQSQLHHLTYQRRHASVGGCRMRNYGWLHVIIMRSGHGNYTLLPGTHYSKGLSANPQLLNLLLLVVVVAAARLLLPVYLV